MAHQLSHGSHTASLPAAFNALMINTLELNARPIWYPGFPTKQCCPTNTSHEHVCEEAGFFSLSLFSTWFQFKLNTNKKMEATQLPHFRTCIVTNQGYLGTWYHYDPVSVVSSNSELWLTTRVITFVLMHSTFQPMLIILVKSSTTFKRSITF